MCEGKRAASGRAVRREGGGEDAPVGGDDDVGAILESMAALSGGQQVYWRELMVHPATNDQAQKCRGVACGCMHITPYTHGKPAFR